MSFINVKQTKDFFKARGLKTSEEAIRVLNIEFEKLCRQAASTVQANQLKIVKGVHISRTTSLETPLVKSH